MLYVLYVFVGLLGIFVLGCCGGYLGLIKDIKIKTGTSQMDKGDIIPELQDKWSGTINHYDHMTRIDDIGTLAVVLTVIFVLLVAALIVWLAVKEYQCDGIFDAVDFDDFKSTFFIIVAIIAVALITNVVDAIMLGNFMYVLFGYGTRLILFSLPALFLSLGVLYKIHEG